MKKPFLTGLSKNAKKQRFKSSKFLMTLSLVGCAMTLSIPQAEAGWKNHLKGFLRREPTINPSVASLGQTSREVLWNNAGGANLSGEISSSAASAKQEQAKTVFDIKQSFPEMTQADWDSLEHYSSGNDTSRPNDSGMGASLNGYLYSWVYGTQNSSVSHDANGVSDFNRGSTSTLKLEQTTDPSEGRGTLSFTSRDNEGVDEVDGAADREHARRALSQISSELKKDEAGHTVMVPWFHLNQSTTLSKIDGPHTDVDRLVFKEKNLPSGSCVLRAKKKSRGLWVPKKVSDLILPQGEDRETLPWASGDRVTDKILWQASDGFWSLKDGKTTYCHLALVSCIDRQVFWKKVAGHSVAPRKTEGTKEKLSLEGDIHLAMAPKAVRLHNGELRRMVQLTFAEGKRWVPLKKKSLSEGVELAQQLSAKFGKEGSLSDLPLSSEVSGEVVGIRQEFVWRETKRGSVQYGRLMQVKGDDGKEQTVFHKASWDEKMDMEKGLREAFSDEAKQKELEMKLFNKQYPRFPK